MNTILRLPPHLYYVTTLPGKKTLANINATVTFWKMQHLNKTIIFTHSLAKIVAYVFTAMHSDVLLHPIIVFCFNGLNHLIVYVDVV